MKKKHTFENIQNCVQYPSVLMEDVVYAMWDNVGDLQVHCILETKGQLDVPCLAKAVRLVMEAEPILGCRFVPGWWRSHWVRREDLEQQVLCSLIICHTEEKREESLHRFLLSPCDPRRDFILQIIVLRHTNDIVCVKLHHINADAGGLKDCVYLLSTFYQELRKNRHFRPRMNPPEGRQLKQLYSQIVHLRKCMLLRLFRDTCRFFSPLRHWSFPVARSAKGVKKYIVRSINESQFRQVKHIAHQHQATVNDMLITAFYRAFEQMTNPPHSFGRKLITTVDLRRYLPEKKALSICNMSGFVHSHIGVGVIGSFVETLTRVKSIMDENKAYAMGLGDHCVVPFFLNCFPFSWSHRLLCYCLQHFSFLSLPGLTNMGQLVSEQIEFDSLEIHQAWMTASMIYPPYFVMGVSGFRDSLTLTAGFLCDGEQTLFVNELFSRIIDELTGTT